MDGDKKELTAGLIKKAGRLLLLHNIKHGLRVEPPGGKKNYRETDSESIQRELMEELGIQVEISNFFGEYETGSPEGNFIVKMYTCEITGGEPAILEKDKFSIFGWYSFEEIMDFARKGVLVPNMVSALEEVKRFLEETH